MGWKGDIKNRHILTAEDRKKRGPVKNTIRHRFAKIKNCSPKCPFFPCRLQALSNREFEGRCALKELPKHVQEKMTRLVSGGEEGLDRYILHLQVAMSNKAESSGTMKDMDIEMKHALNLKRIFYGERHKVDLSGGIKLLKATDLFKDVELEVGETLHENKKDEDKRPKAKRLQSKKDNG